MNNFNIYGQLITCSILPNTILTSFDELALELGITMNMPVLAAPINDPISISIQDRAETPQFQPQYNKSILFIIISVMLFGLLIISWIYNKHWLYFYNKNISFDSVLMTYIVLFFSCIIVYVIGLVRR